MRRYYCFNYNFHNSVVVIDKQKKKVDLASIEQEAIYLYLIKQKYISRSRDNSYFYSSVLQFAQSGSTMCSNENFFKSLALIIKYTSFCTSNYIG